MGNWLPITSKLWPRRSNLMYLAEVAVLTRLATGVARVLENRPAKQKDPNMTEGEKKQAMVERFFVEILGTVGYMACLHLGQDLVDRVANNERFLKDLKGGKIDFEKDIAHRNIGDDLKKLIGKVKDLDEQLKKSVDSVYGDNAKNLIFRNLYAEKNPQKGALKKANMTALKEDLGKQLVGRLDGVHIDMDKAFNDIVHEVQPLKKLAQRSNNLAILGIVTGVATSAIVGGTVTQWLNDRVVAPTAKKFFARRKLKKTPVNGAPAIPKVTPQPAQFGQPLPQKPLSLLSPAPGIPASGNPVPPVYLPNPKTQASNTQFAARVMRPIHNPTPLGRPGGLL